MLAKYAEAKSKLLADIAARLKDDGRITTVWLTGSLGRGRGDDISDIDLTVVLTGKAAESLCKRPHQESGRTTPERFQLFSLFGRPALIHENHNNAPPGGTFTFIQYAETALIVDWILVPQSKAQRPPDANVLFDQVGIPLKPVPEPLGNAVRAKIASEKAAFFWMMASVIVKYIARKDTLLFNSWLDDLHWLVKDIESLLMDEEPMFNPKERLPLALTIEEQKEALRGVCQRMARLKNAIVELGGYVPNEPISAVEKRLALI